MLNACNAGGVEGGEVRGASLSTLVFVDMSIFDKETEELQHPHACKMRVMHTRQKNRKPANDTVLLCSCYTQSFQLSDCV